jgi:hypothetical protein
MAGKKAKGDNIPRPETTEWEQGFRGVEVDRTPNEAYTVAGVTSSTTAAEADNEAETGEAPADPA